MIPIWDVNPAHRTPYITVALVAVNVIAFLFWQPTLGTDTTEDDEIEFIYEYAMIPCEITNLDQLSDQLASECGADVDDPGDDMISQWEVDWGDGSPREIFASDATSASHVYQKPGTFTPRVVATDEDGTGAFDNDPATDPYTG